jgi:hypothetical protein
MANTNSTIFEITGIVTSFPFPTAQSGTIETIGKDVIGTGTFFQGVDSQAEIVLGGTVDAIDSVSLGYISGGPNPTGAFQICGAVPAAIDLPTMAIDIATAINSSSTNIQWQASSNGNSVFIYPVEPANTDALVVVVNMASTSTMTAQPTPFFRQTYLAPELRGQQWIWNPGGKEVSKVDFVRDNVSAHLKDAFVTDIPALSTFYTIEENHWHAINFLNVGTASGYIDGVEVPQGVSVSFNKANQDGFGTFNMIDPKVIDASTEGCKFLVTVY